MAGSGMSWPYMNNAPMYGEGVPSMTFHPAINTSGEQVSQPVNFQGSSNITSPSKSSIADTTKNATKAAAKPNRDYKNMTLENVQGMTDLEKMYRNSQLVNTMPMTYKGTVDNPAVIAPLAHPIDIIKPGDKAKIVTDALAITQAGTHLKTKFWDI